MAKGCLSCEVAKGTKTPFGGKIIETAHFNAHQDVAYSVPGLVILSSNRHFLCLDEMTDEEAEDYLQLMRRIRAVQRQTLGIEQAYYFYNEDTTHHFHLWMLPRYDWMKSFGRSVESVRPVLLYAREHMSDTANLERVAEDIEKLKHGLSKYVRHQL
jgi:diadenosine tetraphosphate (Ap4A) HIT family hydrolase